MHRDAIEDDEVMLFIFPKKQSCQMWMYNVKFDLDVAFLDDNLNIIEIRSMYAYPQEKSPRFFCDKLTKSSCPVKYAFEAKAGFFEANDLGVGDNVREFVPSRILHELRLYQ